LTTPISHNSAQNTGIAALIKASNSNTPPPGNGTSLFGEDGFTFGDVIDIVNPLQHIPIINSIYRKISGDTIAPAMEIAGGALFGGPLGAALSFVTTIFQSQFNTDNADPGSPDMNRQSTTNNPTAIANKSSQQFPATISDNDYSQTNNLAINQTNNHNLSSDGPRTWILSSININKGITTDITGNSHASINTLKNRHSYRPGDGIVNLAYKNTENYSNAITSTGTPSNSIDITIGSNSETAKPAFSI
jgi:hypothetical protein